MEEIEEDKIANEVLEGLPPSFMVFGAKKALDPLEEFWMNKLTSIERQYDQHIVEIERKLLSDRASKRSVKKQASKIAKLREEVSDKATELQSIKSKTEALEGKLRESDYEATVLHDKLERANEVSKSISKRMQDERHARQQYEKECTELKTRLNILEREKAQLCLDMEIKESEKARVEEREANLKKERWSFIKNLTEVDTERRIQTNTNVKLCQDIEKLLNVEKTLEVNLLKERQIMSSMMEEMKNQRQEHHNALRKLDITIKEKRDACDALENSFKKTKDLERNVNHWKEELHFKELDNSSQSKEIGDLKRRNSKIRCVLADSKQKLNNCLSELKFLANEKRRVEVELESAIRHEKTLHLEIRKNEIRKHKRDDKILKSYPILMKNDMRTNKEIKAGHDTTRNEIEGYKKKIWKLERHRDEVDRKIRELQRKENIYRIKLDKYAGIEKQIFWTGKAMAKLEGDRNRLEGLLKTMESNMPIKVPFKKLVTDPSVLDRLAKNKVLQKRLFQQAEKIEELKSNARKILQFREEQFGAMDGLQEEVPVWKMSHWSKTPMVPHNVYSGMHLDVMQQLPAGKGLRAHKEPFTDKEYYRNYMKYLNDEIPKLKGEIRHLEKKKLYNEIEKEIREVEAKTKSKQESVERVNLTELLAKDEQQAAEPSDVDEDNGGQCTPELSMHGSSYNEGKELKETKQHSKMASQVQKQVTKAGSSSTEDEKGDSTDAGSELPSDKSSER